MKKLILASLAMVFAAGTLMAADGATVYKKCIACHGANGEKIAPGSKGNVKIGGMDKARLVEQLNGYKAGTADNGGAKAIMYAQMKPLQPDDIEAVADFIANLPKAN